MLAWDARAFPYTGWHLKVNVFDCGAWLLLQETGFLDGEVDLQDNTIPVMNLMGMPLSTSTPADLLLNVDEKDSERLVVSFTDGARQEVFLRNHSIA